MPGYGMMFDKSKQSLPWTWAAKCLATAHNYWLATTRPDGKPHVMPVWGVWLNEAFFFSTGRQSRKSRNMLVAPNCVICPEHAEEAVILEGIASEIMDPITLKRFARAYKKKYQWDLSLNKDPVYAVRPRTVFGFIENRDSIIKGNPTRWRFADIP